MPLVTDDAIILQSFPYSETSKILRLLTTRHGVRSAIARGALRPRSRYGGVLEPFSEGVATFYLKEGRDLNTLSGFELVRSRQRLGRDLVRFGAASLLAELVLRTASEEAEPALFAQLRAGLDELETVSPDGLEAAALAEAWALVRRLGFGPEVSHCIVCARLLGPEEEAVFDYVAGGVHCLACAGGVTGRRVQGRARAALAALCAGDAVRVERPPAYWRLLERFLSHHVLEGAPLRSLAFLSESLEG